MPSGPTCNLRHFSNRQAPATRSVKFRQTRKSDVGYIKIESHSDGIGGDQIVHFARLEHGDLRIASARTERTHDHCSPPTHAAQSFGHRIDLFDGECDNCRAFRQAGKLLGSGIA